MAVSVSAGRPIPIGDIPYRDSIVLSDGGFALK